MTTIAVRDGVMAADTLGDLLGKRCKSKKLWRLSDGGVFGCSGVWTEGKLFADWYNGGANRDEPPKWLVQRDETVDFHALILLPSGTYLWSYNLVADEMFEDFWAIGTGAAAALAAMHCGKTAQEAVYVAMVVDTYTGGDVETMELAK